MRRIAPAIAILALVACVSIWMSYGWVMDTFHKSLQKRLLKDLKGLRQGSIKYRIWQAYRGGIDAPSLFLNNTREWLLLFCGGIVSLWRAGYFVLYGEISV